MSVDSIVVNIHEAKTNLSVLIHKIENGEEVVIARSGKPVAKLIPYTQEIQKKRELGFAKGSAQISENFDEDISDLFSGGLV
ncbi:hypothetical protein CH373_16160 [Leptospira perolatii]|uniref:Antitoxin n=1 Tax=Leptospira perolatii TaxID=2023191 RepID=A0A2M9ZJA3_9LEPT|nr:type II toxin-antitoxin system prevent-host-death family antitoxin [Leptospira perolatii]PJZ68430.1 hypothetical protein CH360_16360 [Leptospira perolatii]PJZ72129.1 hypothetical protein CH373_16160 [Leptospira perolatii]